MSINSMIGNGLSPQYDLSLQGVTNHAMDLPLQQIETPQFDATKLLNVQPQITGPDKQIQLSDSAIKTMNKAANKALIKSIAGDIFGHAPQNISDVTNILKNSGDEIKGMWSATKGIFSGSRPQDEAAKQQAELIKQQNALQTKNESENREASLVNALDGGSSSYQQFINSQGPTSIMAPQKEFTLDSNGIVQYGERGAKLNKQDKFDLNLGRFYRNTLEGPNYTGLESYDKNIKDAKSLANSLIKVTPKQSNIPIMQQFIDYRNKPNFKIEYLQLFR